MSRRDGTRGAESDWQAIAVLTALAFPLATSAMGAVGEDASWNAAIPHAQQLLVGNLVDSLEGGGPESAFLTRPAPPLRFPVDEWLFMDFQRDSWTIHLNVTRDIQFELELSVHDDLMRRHLDLLRPAGPSDDGGVFVWAENALADASKGVLFVSMYGISGWLAEWNRTDNPDLQVWHFDTAASKNESINPHEQLVFAPSSSPSQIYGFEADYIRLLEGWLLDEDDSLLHELDREDGTETMHGAEDTMANEEYGCADGEEPISIVWMEDIDSSYAATYPDYHSRTHGAHGYMTANLDAEKAACIEWWWGWRDSNDILTSDECDEHDPLAEGHVIREYWEWVLDNPSGLSEATVAGQRGHIHVLYTDKNLRDIRGTQTGNCVGIAPADNFVRRAAASYAIAVVQMVRYDGEDWDSSRPLQRIVIALHEATHILREQSHRSACEAADSTSSTICNTMEKVFIGSSASIWWVDETRCEVKARAARGEDC